MAPLNLLVDRFRSNMILVASDDLYINWMNWKKRENAKKDKCACAYFELRDIFLKIDGRSDFFISFSLLTSKWSGGIVSFAENGEFGAELERFITFVLAAFSNKFNFLFPIWGTDVDGLLEIFAIFWSSASGFNISEFALRKWDVI